jgi:hypothetical protein
MVRNTWTALTTQTTWMVHMADSNSIMLAARDMDALADRLLSRGISKLTTDTTEQTRDLRTASRVIRALLGEVDKAAAVAGDLSRLLRELRVSVEC